jgi:hypothetical protein
MRAFYTQQADQILPIFGVSSIDEARDYVGEADYVHIVETNEAVYMHVDTGSVDFESGWNNLEGLVEVDYCTVTEAWVEV